MEGLKGARIFVTGGAGFIGSHLTQKLIDVGANVTVLDLKKSNTFNSLIVDILNGIKLAKTFARFNPHFVFHLAAEALVTKSIDNPVRTLETNIMGTVNVLEAARQLRSLRGVIVASSDKAYGKTKRAYIEQSPLAGDHPYDVSKSAADLISNAYAKTYDLPVVITRFGNVYGEGDLHFDRIIPGICQAIVRNETLKIRSDGTYVRDYLYVKDVVDGYIHLARKINQTRGQAFNFSSDDTLSVLEVIQTIERALHITVRFKIHNIARNEIPYQHLNDQKARVLGWKNNYTLAQTIPTILKWYRNHS